MQRMGPRPIFCLNQFSIEIDANIDADAHADVTCKQGFNIVRASLQSYQAGVLTLIWYDIDDNL